MEHGLVGVMQAEERLRQAMETNDVAGIGQWLHEELLFTDFTGALVGKEEDLAAHRSGVVTMSSVSFVEELVMRLYGQTAIVAVKAHVEGTFQGTAFAGLYRYLRVWHFEDERWQVIAGNVSVVADLPR